MFGRATKATEGDIKKQVLDAAVALLGDHGLRKLTQPQVAKKAGVRQSHVTYYFPRRSDLISAVARSYVESVGAEVLALVQDTGDEDRGRLLNAFTTAVVGNRQRARTLIGLLIASEELPELREQLVQGVLGLRSVMAQLLGVPEGDPAATILQATLWGLAIQHLLLEGRQSEPELKRLIAFAGKQLGPGRGKRS